VDLIGCSSPIPATELAPLVPPFLRYCFLRKCLLRQNRVQRHGNHPHKEGVEGSINRVSHCAELARRGQFPTNAANGGLDLLFVAKRAGPTGKAVAIDLMAIDLTHKSIERSRTCAAQ